MFFHDQICFEVNVLHLKMPSIYPFKVLCDFVWEEGLPWQPLFVLTQNSLMTTTLMISRLNNDCGSGSWWSGHIGPVCLKLLCFASLWHFTLLLFISATNWFTAIGRTEKQWSTFSFLDASIQSFSARLFHLLFFLCFCLSVFIHITHLYLPIKFFSPISVSHLFLFFLLPVSLSLSVSPVGTLHFFCR